MEKDNTLSQISRSVNNSSADTKALAKQISEYINGNSLSQIAQNLQQIEALMSCYRCAIMEVETKFNVLNEELSILYERNPIETIKTRLKSPESILEKLERKGFSLGVENIEKNRKKVLTNQKSYGIINKLTHEVSKDGPVVQLVRTPACHVGGRGFEPLPGRHLKIRLCSSVGRAGD